MNVLIVDDSDMMRRVLKLAFAQNMEESAYHITEARNGAEAWETILRDTTIGLIFVDWNMPVLNGFDLVKKIRARGMQTPIIMVSSVSDEAMIHEAIQAGVSSYMRKPVRVTDVWEQVQEYIP
ncbi:response regulator [Novosphingobium sp.]|uniref:response regulator n=1 Tax=Novosphingobium sp. TaxID=1874826 RepID=UPI003D0C9BA5